MQLFFDVFDLLLLPPRDRRALACTQRYDANCMISLRSGGTQVVRLPGSSYEVATS